MSNSEKHAVTGAFGYSGRYITQGLLDRGREVITLTHSPERPHPWVGRIKAFSFDFDRPERLEKNLEGVKVLYNTYWVRFNHSSFTQSDAVRNTKVLFRAAKSAGVERIVHVSITNPSKDSPLEYFRGKAELEGDLVESGLSHAILRPTVLFGKEDILINNMAWILRRFPFFPVFGNGQYRLQPIFVDDLARLAIEQGEARENRVIQATGPETFTYRALVRAIGEGIGKPRPLLCLPPFLVYALGCVLAGFLHDVVITRGEIEGLMDELLFVDAPPAGTFKLTEWIRAHREALGRKYRSELKRREDRRSAYV
jgi:NADH dehydrogenase